MTFDLFESAGVEVLNPEREPVSWRRRVRSLHAHVQSLVDSEGDQALLSRAKGVARRAELLGAHSVARAVRWWMDGEAWCRHGGVVLDDRLMRITERWVKREETGCG